MDRFAMAIAQGSSPLEIMSLREVRDANEAGAGIAMLTETLDAVTWANAAGRALLGIGGAGHPATGPLPANLTAVRQIKATGRILAARGEARLLMRPDTGLAAKPVVVDLKQGEAERQGTVLLTAAGMRTPEIGDAERAARLIAESGLKDAAAYDVSGVLISGTEPEDRIETLSAEIAALIASDEGMATVERQGRLIHLARVSSTLVLVRQEAISASAGSSFEDIGEPAEDATPTSETVDAVGAPAPSRVAGHFTVKRRKLASERGVNMNGLVQRWHKRENAAALPPERAQPEPATDDPNEAADEGMPATQAPANEFEIPKDGSAQAMRTEPAAANPASIDGDIVDEAVSAERQALPPETSPPLLPASDGDAATTPMAEMRIEAAVPKAATPLRSHWGPATVSTEAEDLGDVREAAGGPIAAAGMQDGAVPRDEPFLGHASRAANAAAPEARETDAANAAAESLGMDEAFLDEAFLDEAGPNEAAGEENSVDDQGDPARLAAHETPAQGDVAQDMPAPDDEPVREPEVAGADDVPEPIAEENEAAGSEEILSVPLAPGEIRPSSGVDDAPPVATEQVEPQRPPAVPSDQPAVAEGETAQPIDRETAVILPDIPQDDALELDRPLFEDAEAPIATAEHAAGPESAETGVFRPADTGADRPFDAPEADGAAAPSTIDDDGADSHDAREQVPPPADPDVLEDADDAPVHAQDAAHDAPEDSVPDAIPAAHDAEEPSFETRDTPFDAPEAGGAAAPSTIDDDGADSLDAREQVLPPADPEVLEGADDAPVHAQDAAHDAPEDSVPGAIPAAHDAEEPSFETRDTPFDAPGTEAMQQDAADDLQGMDGRSPPSPTASPESGAAPADVVAAHILEPSAGIIAAERSESLGSPDLAAAEEIVDALAPVWPASAEQEMPGADLAGEERKAASDETTHAEGAADAADGDASSAESRPAGFLASPVDAEGMRLEEDVAPFELDEREGGIRAGDDEAVDPQAILPDDGITRDAEPQQAATPNFDTDGADTADDDGMPPVSELAASGPDAAPGGETSPNDRARGFVPRFDMAPVRFVWQIDRDGQFRALSPEFAAAVGPEAADVLGRSFREVAQVFGFDAGGEIARLLDRRDTWSGRSIFWPVENSDRKVPVDLAALPVYARDRSFDGFRGFGILRMNESIEDADAIGRLLAGHGLGGREAEAAPLAPSEGSSGATPPSSPAERPLLRTFEAESRSATFGRRHEPPATAPDDDAGLPKVIRLEERRRPRDGALSQAEEAAFRAIGMKLGHQSEAESPGALRFGERPEPQDADEARKSASDGQEDNETPVSEPSESASASASDDFTRTADDGPFSPSDAQGGMEEAPGVSVIDDRPATGTGPAAQQESVILDETMPAGAGDGAAPVEGLTDEPSHGPPDGVRAFADGGEPSGIAADLEMVLGSLPLPILVQMRETLVFANREFNDLTGYAGIAELEAEGGLERLFVEREDGLKAGELAIRRSNGQVFDVRVHMQRISFSGRSCLLMSFAPSPRDSFAPSPRDSAASAHPAAGPKEAAAPLDEAADKASHEDLRQQVEELQAVLDTATDGVVLLDPAGTIRGMNGSAHALFGTGQEDKSGRHLSTLFAHESQRSVVDYLETLGEEGLAGILNDGREVIGRVAQGGFIPLFITIGRLSGERGWCVVIRDIAHWKRIEEDLVNARRQAEAASLHKSRFLANISHELRTPLNAIIGFADVMASECFGPIGNERYLEYLGDIKRSGHHVLDLVNDLLDISKIEAGKLDLAFEAVSLNEVVSEVVSLMQPQANRERVIVRSNLPASVPPVVADRRTMRQIALNLVANAIRFTPAGGQIIASTTYTAEGDVLLRFRDSGIGMTEREIEIALTPFQQVHAPSANRGEGTGLGLPLTKAMVEANRAQFAINSTPGEGTLVEISFPSQRVLAD